MLITGRVHFAYKICSYLEDVGVGELTLNVTLIHALKHRIWELYADLQYESLWPLQCITFAFVLYVYKPNNANRHDFCP